MGETLIVPPSTRVRTSRVKNIETERLVARLAYLGEHLSDPAPNVLYDSRAEFRGRVREVVAIEDELAKRDVAYERVTRATA